MDKKYKSNLIITLICTMIVMTSLYFIYPNFQFHTYGTVTYFDYLLSYQDEQISIKNYEICKDEDHFQCGGGTLTLNQPSQFVDHQEYQCLIMVEDNEGKTYTLEHSFIYIDQQNEYILDNIEEINQFHDIQRASFEIINQDNQILYKHTLEVIAVESIYGANKEYRIENACLSPYYMRLGYLTTTNHDIIKEYPQVSLEYRYLKNDKADENDDDNYVVFKKISGKSKDLVNKKYYDSYIQDKEKGDLTKKKLSVVVIFSKENSDQTFVFKMDLSKEAGETNE